MQKDEDLFKPLIDDMLPSRTKFVFVSDLFVEDYSGGAELSLEALIASCPDSYTKIRSSELTLEHLSERFDSHWVFGNFSGLRGDVLQAIAANLRYSVLEFDYKFCKHRSIEKHFAVEGASCDCHETSHGRTIASFLAAAEHLWWMSERQQRIYLERFPFLIDYPQQVLSSVFSHETLERLSQLRGQAKDGKWIVLDSGSWIKGTDGNLARAKELGLDVETVRDLPYDLLLQRLARATGLVFCPPGGDTCPRLVIEAKLLGCQLELNDNVQHAREDWFVTDDLEAIEEYLLGTTDAFWRETNRIANGERTLSGYTTTYNCVDQEYPLRACLESMLRFCDEVVVVDGGSTDATMELLRAMQDEHPVSQQEEPFLGPRESGRESDAIEGTLNVPGATSRNERSKLKVFVVSRDWSDERSALFDGMQKAEARKFCTSDFLWQFDSDELVSEGDAPKVRELVKRFPSAIPLLGMPIVDLWGSAKMRLDSTPWKWRLSRNSPRITHGIPAHLRSKDEQGRNISLPGSDGCDLIDSSNGDPIAFLGFCTRESETLRARALSGDVQALREYESWFERVVQNLPTTWHLSWQNLSRKIRTYSTNPKHSKSGNRSFAWSRHWNSLYGQNLEDVPESNMFFPGRRWADVTDEDIEAKAKELEENCGGHVFHTPYVGKKTPWMTLENVKRPSFLSESQNSPSVPLE